MPAEVWTEPFKVAAIWACRALSICWANLYTMVTFEMVDAALGEESFGASLTVQCSTWLKATCSFAAFISAETYHSSGGQGSKEERGDRVYGAPKQPLPTPTLLVALLPEPLSRDAIAQTKAVSEADRAKEEGVCEEQTEMTVVVKAASTQRKLLQRVSPAEATATSAGCWQPLALGLGRGSRRSCRQEWKMGPHKQEQDLV